MVQNISMIIVGLAIGLGIAALKNYIDGLNRRIRQLEKEVKTGLKETGKDVRVVIEKEY